MEGRRVRRVIRMVFIAMLFGIFGIFDLSSSFYLIFFSIGLDVVVSNSPDVILISAICSVVVEDTYKDSRDW